MSTTEIPRPPAGFTPNGDPHDGRIIDWWGPSVEGNGYRILTGWTVHDGPMFWVEVTGAGDPLTSTQALALAADLVRAVEGR